MAFDIAAFKAQLTLDGARPSLFQVTINNPVDNNAFLKIPFMVKAAGLPETATNPIVVGYMGRDIKVPGKRTFQPWNVTIINDEDFLVRNGFEAWGQALNLNQSNVRNLASSSPLLYKSTAQVTQFSKTGVPLRTYEMQGLWPSLIGNIELNWDNGDQIEEFQVQLEYDYWTIVQPTITGFAGGDF